MATSETSQEQYISTSEFQGVTAARDRIVASGALGRSPVYAQLLDYLLRCADEQKQPKEFDIAVDVLGRDGSFDVSRDSVVRVYIHQLRNRLEKYYRVHEPHAEFRLMIPKGQYVVQICEKHKTNMVTSEPTEAQPNLIVGRIRTHALWACIALALVAANVWQWSRQETSPITLNVENALQQPLWSPLLDDDIPVMIVMGDYYIFGELDEQGRIARMVRDFFINSREDLHQLFMQDAQLQSYFRDLDMTYMPEGSASALLNIAPLVYASGKRTQIKMMSRVTTADLRNNHIIYIGYVSALDKLNNLFFSVSPLLPGDTFDQLFDRERGLLYTSNAGLPEQGQPFKDLGLIASWQGATGNHYVIISGTRDAGLMHSATVASNAQLIQNMLSSNPDRNHIQGIESLFEVYGIDRMNFDATLIYSRPLTTAGSWSAY